MSDVRVDIEALRLSAFFATNRLQGISLSNDARCGWVEGAKAGEEIMRDVLSRLRHGSEDLPSPSKSEL